MPLKFFFWDKFGILFVEFAGFSPLPDSFRLVSWGGGSDPPEAEWACWGEGRPPRGRCWVLGGGSPLHSAAGEFFYILIISAFFYLFRANMSKYPLNTVKFHGMTSSPVGTLSNCRPGKLLWPAGPAPRRTMDNTGPDPPGGKIVCGGGVFWCDLPPPPPLSTCNTGSPME